LQVGSCRSVVGVCSCTNSCTCSGQTIVNNIIEDQKQQQQQKLQLQEAEPPLMAALRQGYQHPKEKSFGPRVELANNFILNCQVQVLNGRAQAGEKRAIHTRSSSVCFPLPCSARCGLADAFPWTFPFFPACKG